MITAEELQAIVVLLGFIGILFCSMCLGVIVFILLRELQKDIKEQNNMENKK